MYVQPQFIVSKQLDSQSEKPSLICPGLFIPPSLFTTPAYVAGNRGALRQAETGGKATASIGLGYLALILPRCAEREQEWNPVCLGGQ